MPAPSKGMMGNKWVQASILFGTCLGLFIGTWISLINPIAPLIMCFPFGFSAIIIGASARGTNGFGGPYFKDDDNV